MANVRRHSTLLEDVKLTVSEKGKSCMSCNCKRSKATLGVIVDHSVNQVPDVISTVAEVQDLHGYGLHDMVNHICDLCRKKLKTIFSVVDTDKQTTCSGEPLLTRCQLPSVRSM